MMEKPTQHSHLVALSIGLLMLHARLSSSHLAMSQASIKSVSEKMPNVAFLEIYVVHAGHSRKF